MRFTNIDTKFSFNMYVNANSVMLSTSYKLVNSVDLISCPTVFDFSTS